MRLRGVRRLPSLYKFSHAAFGLNTLRKRGRCRDLVGGTLEQILGCIGALYVRTKKAGLTSDGFRSELPHSAAFELQIVWYCSQPDLTT